MCIQRLMPWSYGLPAQRPDHQLARKGCVQIDPLSLAFSLLKPIRDPCGASSATIMPRIGLGPNHSEDVRQAAMQSLSAGLCDPTVD